MIPSFFIYPRITLDLRDPTRKFVTSPHPKLPNPVSSFFLSLSLSLGYFIAKINLF